MIGTVCLETSIASEYYLSVFGHWDSSITSVCLETGTVREYHRGVFLKSGKVSITSVSFETDTQSIILVFFFKFN